MRDYARIDQNNIVVELISLDDAADITTCFHPDLVFVEVTGIAGVEIGWVHSGGTVVPPGPPPPPTKPELITYAANARYARAVGGVIISSISPIAFFTDPVSRNTIDSANNYAIANPGHITDWKMSDGSFIQLSQAQLATALQDVATFVQSCFTCESDTDNSINGGTITTFAEIDAAFAAISNVFP